LVFDFLLLDRKEFLAESKGFAYRNMHGKHEEIELPERCIAYTICQVPVILQASDEPRLEVHFSDGSIQQINGYVLDSVNSEHIFQRDGSIHDLVVSITSDK
jgi:hypothetical protein